MPLWLTTYAALFAYLAGEKQPKIGAQGGAEQPNGGASAEIPPAARKVSARQTWIASAILVKILIPQMDQNGGLVNGCRATVSDLSERGDARSFRSSGGERAGEPPTSLARVRPTWSRSPDREVGFAVDSSVEGRVHERTRLYSGGILDGKKPILARKLAQIAVFAEHWTKGGWVLSPCEIRIFSPNLAFYSRLKARTCARTRARAAARTPPLKADLPPRRTRLRSEIPEPSGGFNVKTGLVRVRPGSNAANCLLTL